ncbi:MAG: hypothetical protein Q8N13_07345 [Acidovorax sp.]|nr:hypothetical protein [Acidovorax sp.]
MHADTGFSKQGEAASGVAAMLLVQVACCRGGVSHRWLAPKEVDGRSDWAMGAMGAMVVQSCYAPWVRKLLF